MAVKNIKLHLEYLKIAVKTALEYRTSFIIQCSSMFLNDLIWVVFWLLFFTKFNTVAGWKFDDMLLLYAMITLSYGLSGVLLGNRNAIATLISQGKIDYYLTLPKNILYHLLMSKSSWFAAGDILFGLALAVMAVPSAKMPFFILLVLISATILLSFNVIAGSLAFYIGNSEEISTTLINGNISLSSYPLEIYTGVSRIIVLTVIPAGFITGVPVELIRSFNLTWFLLMLGFAILIFSIAAWLFYNGLKRYESGNLLHVRI